MGTLHMKISFLCVAWQIRFSPISPMGQIFAFVLAEFIKCGRPFVLTGYFAHSDYGVVSDLFVTIVQQLRKWLKGIIRSALPESYCCTLSNI